MSPSEFRSQVSSPWGAFRSGVRHKLLPQGLTPGHAHAAMAFQTLIIGPGYLMGQAAAKAFDPLILISLRTVMAALLLLPVFYAFGGWRRFRPSRGQWRGLLILALIGVVINNSLFIIGLRYTTPANSALLYALSPALVLLLAVGWLRDERLSLGKAVGVAIAFAGVVILFTAQGRGFEGDLVVGNAITLLAVLLWAGYLTYSRRVLPGLSPMQVPPVVIGMAALLLLPAFVVRVSQLGWPEVSSAAWAGLAYLTIVNSVVSYLIVQGALSRLRASQVAIYMNLQPISAFTFSWMMGKDHLTWGLALGATLTLGGILLLNLAQRRVARLEEGAAQ